MNITPVDRYFAAEYVKHKADEVHKRLKVEAQIYLDESREKGRPVLTSTYFGEEAGEYKRSKVRAKHIVEYNVCDAEALEDWINDNAYSVFLYAKANTEQFAKWLVEETGELPDGIARVEYDKPPSIGDPKIYGLNYELVEKRLSENGNIFAGANQLLLGDGDV